MKAPYFLQAGLSAMKDRAATYDKPEGERSMASTVEAFRAITGHDLSEEAGWMFMAILKMVRSQQGQFGSDSYADGASYFGLAGEAAHKARAPKLAPDGYNSEITADAFQINTLPVSDVPDWPNNPKWEWMAQDEDGTWFAYDKEPVAYTAKWTSDGVFMRLCSFDKNPNWRNTLRRRNTNPEGAMLHCADCSAEHCPCVAR